jgi:phosphomethylpyrimidine synthase
MARARVALNLDRQVGLSLDPEKVRTLAGGEGNGHSCAVCGSQCAARVAAEYFGIA